MGDNTCYLDKTVQEMTTDMKSLKLSTEPKNVLASARNPSQEPVHVHLNSDGNQGSVIESSFLRQLEAAACTWAEQEEFDELIWTEYAEQLQRTINAIAD
jgi:hypothetical protein